MIASLLKSALGRENCLKCGGSEAQTLQKQSISQNTKLTYLITTGLHETFTHLNARYNVNQVCS